jgi:hypothetical protein
MKRLGRMAEGNNLLQSSLCRVAGEARAEKPAKTDEVRTLVRRQAPRRDDEVCGSDDDVVV